MKRFLTYMLLASLCMLSGCLEEADISVSNIGAAPGYVTLEFGVDYAGGQTVDKWTKAFADKPDIENLHLAVFGEDGYLTDYVLATETDGHVVDNGSTNHKKYKATLPETSGAVVIHFIANGPDQIDFGTQIESIGSLTTSGNQDAYWQMVRLPAGSLTKNGVNSEATNNLLKEIALIRNFAKVTVSANSAETSNFTLSSAYIVNNANKGTVAPYNRSRGAFMEDYKTYNTTDTLISTTHYDGYIPLDVTLNQTSPVDSDFKSVDANGEAFDFIYERETPTESPVYFIVKGKFKDDTDYCYYKIEFRDPDGNYFPILRNFNYKINIIKVSRRGVSSIEEALVMPGSGDISTSLENEGLINISNGESRIFVSYTDTTVVNNNQIELQYRFVPDVNNNPDVAANQTGDTSVDHTEVTLGPADELLGAAITAWSVEDSDVDGYRTIKITPASPGTAMNSQYLTIVGKKKNSDGTFSTITRKVTVYVREKLKIIVQCDPASVAKSTGTAVDVILEIPSGLPKMMFPLQFTLESDKLSIMPNNDNLPLLSGASIINDDKTAFKFMKEVSWDAYNAASTKVEADNNEYRLISCHFKTNTDISACSVYAANQYFDTTYGSFTNYDASTFSNLTYKINDTETAGPLSIDTEVNFSFDMSTQLSGTDKVIVTLDGFEPADNETDLHYIGMNDGLAQYEYVQQGLTGNNFDIISTSSNGSGNVMLQATQYADASKSIDFTGLEFKNLSFTEWSGQSTTFSFSIDELPSTGYITVTLDGLEPDNESKLVANGDGTYKYKPTSTGTQTLNLKSTITKGMTSVALTSRGFQDASVTQKIGGTKRKVTLNSGIKFDNVNSSDDRYNKPFGYRFENKTLGTVYVSADPYASITSSTPGTEVTSSSEQYGDKLKYTYKSSSAISNIEVDDDAKYLYFIYTYEGTVYYGSLELTGTGDVTFDGDDTVYFSARGTKATFSFNDQTMGSGSSKTLVSGTDYTGVESDATVTFVSSDESVVSVSGYTLTAGDVSSETVAYVTANYEGQGSDVFKVTVVPKSVPSLVFKYDTLNVMAGVHSSNIIVTNTSGGDITYTSSDPDYVTVNPSTGVITGVKVTGTNPVTITATVAATGSYASTSASYKVNVVKGEGALTVNYDGSPISNGSVKDMFVGSSKTLEVTSNSGGAISYEISDESKVHVADGKIYADATADGVTVKVKLAATADYSESEFTFTVNVIKKIAREMSIASVKMYSADVFEPVITLTEPENGGKDISVSGLDGAIVYTVPSAAQNFFTISSSDTNRKGTITSNYGGYETTVTATLPASEMYEESTTTFKVTVDKRTPVINYTSPTASLTRTNNQVDLKVSVTGVVSGTTQGTLKCVSGTLGLEVTDKGVVTATKGGIEDGIIKITVDGNEWYNAAAPVQCSVSSVMSDATLTIDPTTISLYTQGPKIHPTTGQISITTKGDGLGTVSYTSSDSNICEVDNNGYLNALNKSNGTATITVSAQAIDSNWCSDATATCTVTVTKVHWVLVNQLSELNGNDVVMITNTEDSYVVCKDYNANSAQCSSITFVDTESYNDYKFTLVGSSGSFKFKSVDEKGVLGGDVYLYISSSRHTVRCDALSSPEWTVKCSDSNATMKVNNRYLSVGSSLTAQKDTAVNLHLYKYYE